MSQYYYFIASLPRLDFQVMPLPVPWDVFLEQSKQHLSGSDFANIKDVLSKDEMNSSQNNLLEKWREFNHSLRNELVYFRCMKKGVNPVQKVVL